MTHNTPELQNFAAFLQEACRIRGATPKGLAASVGVNSRTIENWIQGKVAPSDPRQVARLAQALGRRPEIVFAVLGWSSAYTTDAALRAEAAGLLAESLRQIRQLERQAERLLSVSPTALLVGALMDALPGWTVAAQSSKRGSLFPLPYRHHIYLAPPRGVWPRRGLSGLEKRNLVLSLVNEMASIAGASFRDPARAAMDVRRLKGPWDPECVLGVDSFLEQRPPSLSPTPLRYPQVVVVSPPRVGAPDVGAMLARALGYGFTAVAHATRIHHGIDRDQVSLETWLELQRDTALQLLHKAPVARTVVSSSSFEVVPTMLEALAEDALLVVLDVEDTGVVAQQHKRRPEQYLGPAKAALEAYSKRSGPSIRVHMTPSTPWSQGRPERLAESRRHDSDWHDKYVVAAEAILVQLAEAHPQLSAKPSLTVVREYRDAFRHEGDGSSPLADLVQDQRVYVRLMREKKRGR